MLKALFTLLFVHVQDAVAFSPPSPQMMQPSLVQPKLTVRDSNRGTTSLYLSSSDIQAKLKAQMAKLQERDRSSREISPDVSIVHI